MKKLLNVFSLQTVLRVQNCKIDIKSNLLIISLIFQLDLYRRHELLKKHRFNDRKFIYTGGFRKQHKSYISVIFVRNCL